MAMGYVILTEFHVGRRECYFLDYLKRFTDAPFLVELEKRDEVHVPDKFLTAADLSAAGQDSAPPQLGAGRHA